MPGRCGGIVPNPSFNPDSAVTETNQPSVFVLDSLGLYRYWFNSKEADRAWASTHIYDYGFRVYSPGLARFLSVDPLRSQFPWLTPYQFASNRPIVT